MYYRVYDNSYCINFETEMPAALVQQHDHFYEPDIEEDGAIFTVVSEPYFVHINEWGIDYGVQAFISVKSTKTGNVYRVLYNKSAIY